MTAPDPGLQELACMEAIELIRAHHQRTVDELLGALERIGRDEMNDGGSPSSEIAMLIAKHRKGG
jgi:hypothetical protein